MKWSGSSMRTRRSRGRRWLPACGFKNAPASGGVVFGVSVRAHVNLAEWRRLFASGAVVKGWRSQTNVSAGFAVGSFTGQEHLRLCSGTVCVAKGETEEEAESSCSQTLRGYMAISRVSFGVRPCANQTYHGPMRPPLPLPAPVFIFCLPSFKCSTVIVAAPPSPPPGMTPPSHQGNRISAVVWAYRCRE